MENGIIHKRKLSLDIQELLSRQQYIVVQANDLAKAFGRLTAFEHRLLDYCVSCISKDSAYDDAYYIRIKNVLKSFGLNASGKNYQRVIKAFLDFQGDKTRLCIEIKKENGSVGVRLTQLFDHIDLYEDGTIDFQFSYLLGPLLFDLKKNFYSLRLSELATIRSKYSLILLKLLEAQRLGKSQNATIKGNMLDYQRWFLGLTLTDKASVKKIWPSYRFTRDVIKVAVNELSQHGIDFTVTQIKRGRKTVGYEISAHYPVARTVR